MQGLARRMIDDTIGPVAPRRCTYRLQLRPGFGFREAAALLGTEVQLPDGRWCDRLTGKPQAGGARRVAELLADLPVALLTRE